MRGHLDLDHFSLIVSTLPGWPDVTLLQAAARAGAWAILNLEGVAPDHARTAFAALAENTHGRIGVRIADDELVRWPSSLVDVVDVVVIAGPGAHHAARWLRSDRRTILLECTGIEDARAAADLSIDGLIAKGHEAAGRVGEETTFVLLQRLLTSSTLPVWAQGGVGLHTIGACAVAGCAGVVLDAQLTLARESTLPDAARAALARMSGDETTCVAADGTGRYYRLFSRPSLRKSDPAGRSDLRERESPAWSGASVDAGLHVDWRSTESPVWAIGQDAAFASTLAHQFRSVSGILHGLRDAVQTHVEDARQLASLDRGAPLAASHGIEFPILQGPMTRVSDKAAFAHAVAEAGGLPFLACALQRAPQLRALLQETSELLGKRPWGVGILGFVPLELRDEQLRVIQEFRPPVAIIAGGRPDQASALERQGIHTYLHVPAPALLRMFLADGARRFIFEGRECGGHVGPRTSFVLWESMVQVLLGAISEGVRAEDLHIVFAGGVHDDRSAAMVATIAAPLARLGARIGVLVGTAYLFSREAVETGAIVEGFQREALNCSRTVLLESGPGHATRCAETPFYATFHEMRRRLVEEGTSPDDTRLALETLNLGRLRIASKGITRSEASASSSDTSDRFGKEDSGQTIKYARLSDEEQRQEGMYMIGQVAALRDRVCSIAELHESICSGGVRRLAQVGLRTEAPAIVERRPAAALPANIAIVGMGCVLPKAPDVRALWNNLLNKVDAIEEIPSHRFDAARYYDPDRLRPDKIYSKWGGFLEELPFDPAKYGIPPVAVPSIDPFQLLTLEVVDQALRDAGYADREFDRERTSVILGASGGGGELGFRYGIRAGLPSYLEHVPEKTLAQLPSWTEDSFAGVLLNVAAGRVANRLNLGGLNFTVDAACASSLAAVYLAARELESGTSDMALVGGLDTVNSPFGFMCFSSAQALSPTGRCRTFDERADGIAISEGIVVLVLKRVVDAVRSGDRIYAVLRAVAGSSDGRGKGLTAPKPEGQMRALQRAYAAAGFAASTVGLVEAHGTGTVAGDGAEVAALSTVFAASGALPASCALGSIKSMVGHTKSAAGVAGLMKVALALHHKVLPPTLHVTRPNARLREPTTPFFVNTEARPWVARDDAPRRAAVSSFGFGGTNFHVVVEEYDSNPPGTIPETPPVENWPAELAFWAARSIDDLARLLDRSADAIVRCAGLPLRDIAAAISRTSGPPAANPVRLAIVADSTTSLGDRIAVVRAAAARGDLKSDPKRGIYFGQSDEPPGKVAFLFPGQGSQYPGMHRELAVFFPEIRHALELANRATAGRFSKPLSAYVFPPPAFSDEQARQQLQELTDTAVAQPALGAVASGACTLLGRLGVMPDMTAGHSYGEYVALWAAGVFSTEILTRLSEARGQLIKAAASDDPGTMAAVRATPDAITRALGSLDGVWIANTNSPRQTVLAGRASAMDTAVDVLSAAGMSSRLLPVSCAFHTPLVAGASRGMEAVLQEAPIATPRLPVFSNALGGPYPNTPEEIRRLLSEHITSPVRFAQQVESMYAEGARIFVEVGPRAVLSGLVRETLAPLDPVVISIDGTDGPAVVHLLSGLAQLLAAGVAVDFEELWRGRTSNVPLDRLAPPPPVPPHAWMVNGGRARRQTDPVSFSQPEPIPFVEARSAELVTDRSSEDFRPAVVETSVTVRPVFLGEAMHPDSLIPPPTANDSLDVMRQFQHLMSQFLQTQSLVMTTYLQGAAPAASSMPVFTPAPRAHTGAPSTPLVRTVDPVAPRTAGPSNGNGHSPATAPVAAAIAPAAPATVSERPSAAATDRSPAAVLRGLVQIVSDRTGYPEDMLGVDASIEADLGIDSIKRMEILVAFQQLYQAADRSVFQSVMEKLTTRKTLRETAALLAEVLEQQVAV